MLTQMNSPLFPQPQSRLVKEILVHLTNGRRTLTTDTGNLCQAPGSVVPPRFFPPASFFNAGLLQLRRDKLCHICPISPGAAAATKEELFRQVPDIDQLLIVPTVEQPPH